MPLAGFDNDIEVEVLPPLDSSAAHPNTPALVTELATAITEAPKDLATQLTKAYSTMAQKAAEWLAQAEAIVVTDESHTLAMKQAGLLRLELKKIRCNAENKRKELKEDFLKGGRAVDSIAKIIKDAIEPVEDALLEKEEFATRREAARREALRQARHAELVSLGVNPELYNLTEFTDDQWKALLQSVHDAAEAEKKRKAETEAARARYIEEQRKLREENDRLRKESEVAETARLAVAKEAQETLEAERRAAQDKLDAERRESQEKLAAERKVAAEAMRKSEQEKKDAEAKLAKERADRFAAEQKAAREAQAKIDAANRKLKEEQERAAAIEDDRIAAEKSIADAKADELRRIALAPDKEKLAVYMFAILAVPVPEMSTVKGGAAAKLVATKLNQLCIYSGETLWREIASDVEGAT